MPTGYVESETLCYFFFHRSSYAIQLILNKKQTTLTDQAGLSLRNHAAAGFPIRVRGSACIGVITISGVPMREAHGIIVEVLAKWLNQPLHELALPPAEDMDS